MKFADIDQFLQTVMFSLYGSHQCEAEEEHLLLRVFRTLMAGDLAHAQSINEFFRQNSVLTRMLTTYTRREPGLRYISVVQGGILRDLIAASAGPEKQSLEMNPAKVFDELAARYRAEHGGAEIWGEGAKPTPEEQADLPYVQEAVAARVPVIQGYMERLLSEYERHVDAVPYEMRWICKQVKELIQERWQNTSLEQVCTMIGGFFVLRFLNPALISPAEYGLADTEGGKPGSIKVPPEARRNLTVIAKVQQNLSNDVAFTGTKERFMSPLNCICETLGPRFLRFLDSLTEVDDLDHHLSLDSFVRLANIDKEERVNVTANELYFMHDLVLRNKDALIKEFGPEDPLCVLLGELPPAPQKLPRAEDYDISLKLIPPGAAAAAGAKGKGKGADARSELRKMPPEALFGEAEYHLFNIACAAAEMGTEAFGGEGDGDLTAFVAKTAEVAEAAEDKKLVEHAEKLKVILDELQKSKAAAAKKNFLSLRKALASDIDDIPARVAQSQEDYARLKKALNAVEKCKRESTTQICTYEEYLTNVRTRSVSTSAGKFAQPPSPAVAAAAGAAAAASTQQKQQQDPAGKKGSGKKKGDGKDKTAAAAAAAAASADEDVVLEGTGVVKPVRELCVTGVLKSVAEVVAVKGTTDMKFSVLASGAILITCLKKKKKEEIEGLRVKIGWDELLGFQAAGKKTVRTDLFVYNVNAMVFFINKNIFAKK